MLKGHVLHAIRRGVAVLLWAEEESFGVISVLRAEPHPKYSVIRHVHVEFDGAIAKSQIFHIDRPLTDRQHSMGGMIVSRERGIAIRNPTIGLHGYCDRLLSEAVA